MMVTAFLPARSLRIFSSMLLWIIICFFLCEDRELWIRFQENYKILGIKSKKNVKFTESFSNPLNFVIEVALISSTMSI